MKKIINHISSELKDDLEKYNKYLEKSLESNVNLINKVMKTLAIDLTTSDIKLGLDINGVFSDYKNTDQPNFDNIFFFSQIF